MFQNLLCDFVVEDPLRAKIASIDLKDNDITLKVSFDVPDKQKDKLDNYIYVWSKFPKEVAEFSLLRIATDPTGRFVTRSMLLSGIAPEYGPFPPSDKSERRVYTFKGRAIQSQLINELSERLLRRTEETDAAA